MEEGTKCRRDCRRKPQPQLCSALGAGKGGGEEVAAVTTRRVQEAGAHTGAMGRHQRRCNRTRKKEREIEKEGTSELATPALGA